MTSVTPRREFLGWLGASALVGATPSLLVGAAPPATATRHRRVTATDWDMSWTDRIRAKHRVVFDAPDLAEGDPILRAVVWGKQYQDIFDVAPTTTSRVLILRHKGIHFAMGDAHWARFGLGRETGFLDSSGRGVTVNPIRAAGVDTPAEMREMTLEAFQASGGIVLACQLALTHYVVPRYVATGMSQSEAELAAERDVLPGILMQPSGIFALSVAQEEGCRYVPVS